MVLLDTHVWWWSVTEPACLSPTAIDAIKRCAPEQRAIASISIWEFAMMAARKKIELTISVAKWLSRAIDATGIQVFPLSPEVAVESCRLPGHFHKDPADRIIVATARIHNLPLLTKDGKIRGYPHVDAVW